MKILYLTSTDPRSKSYGGEQRTHFIWEGLKKIAEVHTLIPVAHKHMERVEEGERIHWVCVDRRYTPGWFLRRIWSRYFPRIGLPCGFTPRKLKAIFPFDFDACVVRYATMASYLQAWRLAPLYLDVDDLLGGANRCSKKTMLLMLRCWLSCPYQHYVFRRAKQLFVADEKHQAILKQYSTTYVTNIACNVTDSLQNIVSNDTMLMFAGDLTCDQNYWGLDYFLRNYWDGIVSEFPQLVFKIAGRGLPEKYKMQWAQYKNVHLLGFVTDLTELYSEAIAVLLPLYVGSGSAIKTREALYMGRVCIATEAALRGIADDLCVSRNGIFVFNTQDEIRQSLNVVLDKESRKQLQISAHDFALRHFSQKNVDMALADVFEQP